MKLIFLRHGETKVNVEGKIHITGDNSELTEKGIEQIKNSVSFLKKNKVEKIYCSPEMRAYQSARLVSEELRVSFVVLDGLKERNWGSWERKSWDEIKEILDKMGLDERYKFIPPNGESWQQMESRLKKSLNKITSGSEKCVCVVTHMGSLRGLIPLLKNEDISVSLEYKFENGSFTIFNFLKGRFDEVVVNDITHLK